MLSGMPARQTLAPWPLWDASNGGFVVGSPQYEEMLMTTHDADREESA